MSSRVVNVKRDMSRAAGRAAVARLRDIGLFQIPSGQRSGTALLQETAVHPGEARFWPNFDWSFRSQCIVQPDNELLVIVDLYWETRKPDDTVESGKIGDSRVYIHPSGRWASEIYLSEDFRNDAFYRYGAVLHAWTLRYATEQHTALFTDYPGRFLPISDEYSFMLLRWIGSGMYSPRFRNLCNALVQGSFAVNRTIDLTKRRPGDLKHYLHAAALMPHFRTVFLHFRTMNMIMLPYIIEVDERADVNVTIRTWTWLKSSGVLSAEGQQVIDEIAGFVAELYDNC